jgi:hypothetical protein
MENIIVGIQNHAVGLISLEIVEAVQHGFYGKIVILPEEQFGFSQGVETLLLRLAWFAHSC